MTADERALLNAVIAAPDDDLPRLVYADWLEEHGGAERAEFIRIECELARLTIADPTTEEQYRTLSTRRLQLIEAHYQEWETAVRAHIPPNRQTYFTFGRGMPANVTCTVKYFTDNADALFRVAPIETVYLRRPSPKRLAGLATLPAWTRVHAIGFDADQLDDEAFDTFLSLPLAHLRGLSIFSSVGWAPEIAPAGWAERSAGKATRLSACPQLAGLRRLDLSMAGIGDRGAEALSRSEPLAGLQALLLTHNPLSEESRILLRQRFGSRVIFDYSDRRHLPYGYFHG